MGSVGRLLMLKKFWIDIATTKRHLAIHKSDMHIYVEGGGKLRQGRALTEIERILADEIFRLRAAQPHMHPTGATGTPVEDTSDTRASG